MKLTAEQQAVVRHGAGHARVAAVAGAGKTTTMAARVLHQGKSELARGNMAAGIEYLDSVAAVSGPATAAAREVSDDGNSACSCRPCCITTESQHRNGDSIWSG